LFLTFFLLRNTPPHPHMRGGGTYNFFGAKAGQGFWHTRRDWIGGIERIFGGVLGAFIPFRGEIPPLPGEIFFCPSATLGGKKISKTSKKISVPGKTGGGPPRAATLFLCIVKFLGREKKCFFRGKTSVGSRIYCQKKTGGGAKKKKKFVDYPLWGTLSNILCFSCQPKLDWFYLGTQGFGPCFHPPGGGGGGRKGGFF